MFRPVSALAFICLAATSCVTTHSGDPSKTKNGLAISCGFHRGVSTTKVKSITMTFENLTTDWIDLEIDPESIKGAGMKLLNPEETLRFTEALRNKIAKNNHNLSLAMAGLVVVGAAASIRSGSPTPLLGSAVVATGVTEGKRIDSQRRVLQYGGKHLLGGAIKVPGELFLRRSLVVETEDFRSEPSLEFCSKKGSCFKIQAINPATGLSNLAKPHCEVSEIT